MDGDIQFYLDLISKMSAGGITTGAVIYAIHRKIKGDEKTDNIDLKNQQVIDNLVEQLKNERHENQDLREAVERVAVERNDAVRDLGSLQGEVKSLEAQVTILTEQVVKLEEENRRLCIEVRNMREQFNTMMKYIQDNDKSK